MKKYKVTLFSRRWTKVVLTIIVLTTVTVGGVAYKEKEKRVGIWCGKIPGGAANPANRRFENWAIAGPSPIRGYCSTTQGAIVNNPVPVIPL